MNIDEDAAYQISWNKDGTVREAHLHNAGLSNLSEFLFKLHGGVCAALGQENVYYEAEMRRQPE